MNRVPEGETIIWEGYGQWATAKHGVVTIYEYVYGDEIKECCLLYPSEIKALHKAAKELIPKR